MNKLKGRNGYVRLSLDKLSGIHAFICIHLQINDDDPKSELPFHVILSKGLCKTQKRPRVFLGNR